MAKRAENIRKKLVLFWIQKKKRFHPKELFRTLKTEIFQAPGHQTIEQTELEISIYPTT